MKKYWLFLISLILIAPCVWAQGFKRTTKNPGFFMPQGALQTNNKPEKLVPVDQMRFRGQQAPVVIEMQRQAQEKAHREAEEKAQQAELEKKKQEDEARQKQRQQELAKLRQEEKNTNTEETTDSLSTANIKEEQDTNTSYVENSHKENKKLSPMEEARLKAAGIKSAQNKQTEKHGDKAKSAPDKQAKEQKNEEKFAQIIEEYRREIKAISEKKPLPNKRLINVISDYKDIDHSI